jgi:glycine cleavage system transcriptional repressor
MASFLISVFCPDRVGLVAAITGRLFELGGNLGDTAFAVLGGGAEFTTICDFDEHHLPAALEDALGAVAELRGAEIRVRPFGLDHGPATTTDISHRIILHGGDDPGLMARLTEVFLQFGANIVRLNAVRPPGDGRERYLIRVNAWIPPARADACLAALSGLAGELRMGCEWTAVAAGDEPHLAGGGA